MMEVIQMGDENDILVDRLKAQRVIELERDLATLEKMIIEHNEKKKSKKSLQEIVTDPIYRLETIIQGENLEEMRKRILIDVLKISPNSTITFEGVKCSKICNHKHNYFYAYYRDQGRLRKKYIGKHLPLPYKISISDMETYKSPSGKEAMG